MESSPERLESYLAAQDAPEIDYRQLPDIEPTSIVRLTGLTDPEADYRRDYLQLLDNNVKNDLWGSLSHAAHSYGYDGQTGAIQVEGGGVASSVENPYQLLAYWPEKGAASLCRSKVDFSTSSYTGLITAETALGILRGSAHYDDIHSPNRLFVPRVLSELAYAKLRAAHDGTSPVPYAEVPALYMPRIHLSVNLDADEHLKLGEPERLSNGTYCDRLLVGGMAVQTVLRGAPFQYDARQRVLNRIHLASKSLTIHEDHPLSVRLPVTAEPAASEKPATRLTEEIRVSQAISRGLISEQDFIRKPVNPGKLLLQAITSPVAEYSPVLMAIRNSCVASTIPIDTFVSQLLRLSRERWVEIIDAPEPATPYTSDMGDILYHLNNSPDAM